MSSEMLRSIGGETGCLRLSAAFYARVANDATLRPLFPGKSMRCATEEFAAFLVQFLGGEEEQTQSRWWLSLRESHARFRIAPAQRSAWLQHMDATLAEIGLDEATQRALGQFFRQSSTYIGGKETAGPDQAELAERWDVQRRLDALISAIANGRDEEALQLAPEFAARRAVFAGVLTRMLQSGRSGLMAFVTDAIERDPQLGETRFGGRPMLHLACGAGCLPVVTLILQHGTSANLLDRGDHPPLYAVANECGGEAGPEIVRVLVRAGADVNAAGGATGATPLHMAARRGHTAIASMLLDYGAHVNAGDRKGVTPLRRAIQCRKQEIAMMLQGRGARLTAL